ncbi:MAG: M24 family metallopeptidase [Candidatus Omnitrophica bacterium]|nr:M24 family metallopeptidase [Candidatus Omnitrophota bacterium]
MADFNKRLEKTRNYLSSTKGNGLLVASYPNVVYLTGLKDVEGLLYITKSSSCFFTSSIYHDFASRNIKIPSEVIDPSKKRNFKKVLSSSEKIFFIPSESSCERVENWVKISDKKFLPVKADPVKKLRAIKEKDEIEIIKKSVQISKSVFKELKEFIKPGIKEIEAVGYFLYLVRKKWNAKESFPPIVAFGENASFPHHASKDRELKENDAVLIDFGVNFEGYHSDLTRTYYAGRPTQEFKNIYKIVEDVQKKVIENVAEGKSCKKLFLYAYNLFEKKALGKQFLHGLGHGIGLEIHEAPSLSSKSRDILKENMVITIEPGLYINDSFGVRIEDDILINKNTLQIL